MRVTDEDCAKLKHLYLEHDQVELSLDDAREILSGLFLLFERFAAWVAQEEAVGRTFSLGHSPSGLGCDNPE